MQLEKYRCKHLKNGVSDGEYVLCDSCVNLVLCFSATLPHAQQQPQLRGRLETFDDIIRSSLEVTGSSGGRVYGERKCVWSRLGVQTQMYLLCLYIRYPPICVCRVCADAESLVSLIHC